MPLTAQLSRTLVPISKGFILVHQDTYGNKTSTSVSLTVLFATSVISTVRMGLIVCVKMDTDEIFVLRTGRPWLKSTILAILMGLATVWMDTYGTQP